MNGPATDSPGSYGDRVHGVDRDEAERQERRRDLRLGPGTVAFLAGIVLFTGGLGPVTGVAAWAPIGAFAVVGLLVWSGGLSWFGRLPGDVRIARGATRVYAPWVSILVVSLVLTLAVNLLRRLL